MSYFLQHKAAPKKQTKIVNQNRICTIKFKNPVASALGAKNTCVVMSKNTVPPKQLFIKAETPMTKIIANKIL